MCLSAGLCVSGRSFLVYHVLRNFFKMMIGRVGRTKSAPAVSFADLTARDAHSKSLGRMGEEASVQKLVREGYRILERNYSCRSGEVDIIAEHEGHICFIEVKTRSPRSWNSPESAVTPEKQGRVIRAASYYLANFRTPSPARFDVISVMTDENAQIVSVNLKKNAFAPVAG